MPTPEGGAWRLRAEFLIELDRQIEFAAQRSVGTGAGPGWWRWIDGQLLLRLRFRGRVLAVNGEADTAVLSSRQELLSLLRLVREATVEGALDTLLAQAEMSVG